MRRRLSEFGYCDVTFEADCGILLLWLRYGHSERAQQAAPLLRKTTATATSTKFLISQPEICVWPVLNLAERREGLKNPPLRGPTALLSLPNIGACRSLTVVFFACYGWTSALFR